MLTIDFLKENFKVINELYFNNELVEPRFEITHVKSYLGQYHWHYDYRWDASNCQYSRVLTESVIRISDMFDRTDDDIVNTLAHEMIHLYIRQNQITDTRPHHGRVFYSIADRLNYEGGFHIARTDSVVGCGLRDKTKKNTYYVGCFKNMDGKYFSFVMNEKYITYYEVRFNNYPSYYKDAFIFVSDDDKTFAHYCKCRGSIRGWHIDEETFNLYRECGGTLVYNEQTLSINHSAA